jgi:FkbM family methyltransferase
MAAGQVLDRACLRFREGGPSTMLGAMKRRMLGLLGPALAGRLRAWRTRRLIATFRERVVEHAYGGHRLRVHLSDPLARGWYDQDWPELPEFALLRRSRLRPGAVVFDLGAHQGVVAAMMAREVEPTGRVIAVEANRHNCEAAARNRDLNGLVGLEVVHAAVSDAPGTLWFNEGLNGQIDDGAGAWGRVSVEAVTIDQLIDRFGVPDLVFLDIEGAECRGLAGASRALESGAEFFVEVHVGSGLEKLGGSVSEVFAYFPEDRFTLLGRAEGEGSFRPVRDGDPLTTDRFFLLALRRDATPPNAGPS